MRGARWLSIRVALALCATPAICVVGCETRGDRAASARAELTFISTSTLTAASGAVDDQLGLSVTEDGAWAAVGAPNAATDGRVYLFQRSGDTWVARGELADTTGRPEDFGWAVAMSGDTLAVGVPNADSPSFEDAGQVSVFRQNAGGTWELEQEIENPSPAGIERFGRAVALVGDLLVIGAPSDWEFASSAGAVHVFERTGTTWAPTALLGGSTLTSGDGLGGAVATDGARIVAGADRGSNGTLEFDGNAYVYGRGGTGWVEQAHLRATEGNHYDYLGSSVAIAGTTIVLGAPGADDNHTNEFADEARGVVYVFEESGGTWSETQRIRPTSDAEWVLFAGFGTSVSMTRNLLLVGAPGAESSGATRGMAYVLERGATGFDETGAAIGGHNAQLGASVGLDLVGAAVRAIVGAPGAGTPVGAGEARTFDLRDALSLGEACSDDAACGSGHCVDGVCCDTICGGGATTDCVACSLARGAASDGTCGTVTGTSTVCRPAAGGCDRPERCDGVSDTCPADELEAAGFVCRESVGVCDPEESCDGEGPVCPANDVMPDGTECSNGLACDGMTDHCAAGACAGTLPTDCDDHDPCTADGCADSGGCTHTPIAGCGDAGPAGPDAGPSPDAGTRPDAAASTTDAAVAIVDAGTSAGGSGCGCRVGASPRGAASVVGEVGLVALLLARARRKRTRRCRS
ncbi:MAG: hypothetical protein U0353_33890 [Sandaracinus sp.]